MNNDYKEYRAALAERRNKMTGATEWVVRFTHPSTPLDHGKVAWFSIPDGQSWFTDPEDHHWFCTFLEHRKNVAVKFNILKDAFDFLSRLRPAEIGNDEPARGMARAQ